MKTAWSGIFFLIFLLAAGAAALESTQPSYEKTGSVKMADISSGLWSHTFERKFTEEIPVYETARGAWGKFEYAVFRQGRKGVVTGSDGWLFSDEEFSCPRGWNKNVEENLERIGGVQQKLSGSGIAMTVLLVPAKARVYEEHLGETNVPSCRGGVYGKALHFIRERGIGAPDVFSLMKNTKGHESFYLRTDTHWSPRGAQLAARALAVTQKAKGMDLEKKEYTTVADHAEEYAGDLTRYTPGVKNADALPVFVTSAAGGENDLFGGSAPQAVLVGTSYSANAKWNFEGFLKEELGADVLNMADEGLGPFAVMDKYLAGDPWKENKPRLVIWEIPERYLLASGGQFAASSP